jgi:hypothetical protein
MTGRNQNRQRSLLHRSTVMLSTFVLAGGAAVVMGAPTALAASSPPTVTFTSGPTISAGGDVSIGYSLNRQSKAIASSLCTLTAGTTTTSVSCGSLTSNAKANPATFAVTLAGAGVNPDQYTYTVTVRLTDGGITSAHAAYNVYTCLDGVDTFVDIGFAPPVNTPNNGLFFSSLDGSCTGPFLGTAETIVQAPDSASAAALCEQLAGLGTPISMPLVWPAAPADYWLCS